MEKCFDKGCIMEINQKAGNVYAARDDETMVMVCGSSMKPFFHAGDMVMFQNAVHETIKRGNVVLFASSDNNRRIMHRVVKIVNENGGKLFLCQGDNLNYTDGFIGENEILGRVVGKYRHHQIKYIGRYQEYGSLFASRWYRLAKATAKKAIAAVWPLLMRLFAKKIYVLDRNGHDKELLFIGWGNLRCSRNFLNFSIKTAERDPVYPKT